MHIRVCGIPAPQGSKVAFQVMAGSGPDRHPTGKINQVEASPRVKPWRATVAAAVLEQRKGRSFPRGMPVKVMASFYFPRPDSHYGTGRNSGRLKESAPTYLTGRRNDIDKLLRAVMDGLTDGGIWHDDGQAAMVVTARYYVTGGQQPGCDLWLALAEG